MRISTVRHVICLLIRIECHFSDSNNSRFRREKYSAFHNLSLIKQSESEKEGRFIKEKYTDIPIYINVLEKKVGLTKGWD